MNRVVLVRIALTLAVIGTLISPPATNAAHHGWADFDRSRRVEFSGVIIASRYANPHCYARVRVGDVEWDVELAAVPRMRNRGVTPEMIRPGTEISMVGHPHRRHAHEMKAVRITLGGRTIEFL